MKKIDKGKRFFRCRARKDDTMTIEDTSIPGQPLVISIRNPTMKQTACIRLSDKQLRRLIKITEKSLG